MTAPELTDAEVLERARDKARQPFPLMVDAGTWLALLEVLTELEADRWCTFCEADTYDEHIGNCPVGRALAQLRLEVQG